MKIMSKAKTILLTSLIVFLLSVFFMTIGCAPTGSEVITDSGNTEPTETVEPIEESSEGISDEEPVEAEEQVEEALQTEETETTESASITDEEVLYDFYNPPADWPKDVPIHTDMKVTAYDRTDNSMIASGFGEVDISRISNYYTNAQKEVGGGYPWEFDSDNESVTTGPDQVFYFISEEGQSLTIEITEIEEGVLEFTLDFNE